jgi:hypothetical protein
MPRRTLEIRRSLVTSSAPEVLYRHIIDPMTWPQWQSEILSVEDHGPLVTGDVTRGEADLLGFEVHGHSTATEVTAARFEEEVIVGVRMRIRYDVRAEGTGTVVNHHIVADLPGGACGSVLSLFLKWRLRRMQRTALEGLARQSEGTSPR